MQGWLISLSNVFIDRHAVNGFNICKFHDHFRRRLLFQIYTSLCLDRGNAFGSEQTKDEIILERFVTYILEIRKCLHDKIYRCIKYSSLKINKRNATRTCTACVHKKIEINTIKT